jgi:hypothetical protein
MLFQRAQFSFTPRWKEELICRTPWAVFTAEITMGVLHVYFPDEAKWKKDLPEHLHDKWAQVVQELESWCKNQNIPLSLVPDGWIELHHEENA